MRSKLVRWTVWQVEREDGCDGADQAAIVVQPLREVVVQLLALLLPRLLQRILERAARGAHLLVRFPRGLLAVARAVSHEAPRTHVNERVDSVARAKSLLADTALPDLRLAYGLHAVRAGLLIVVEAVRHDELCAVGQ